MTDLQQRKENADNADSVSLNYKRIEQFAQLVADDGVKALNLECIRQLPAPSIATPDDWNADELKTPVVPETPPLGPMPPLSPVPTALTLEHDTHQALSAVEATDGDLAFFWDIAKPALDSQMTTVATSATLPSTANMQQEAAPSSTESGSKPVQETTPAVAETNTATAEHSQHVSQPASRQKEPKPQPPAIKRVFRKRTEIQKQPYTHEMQKFQRVLGDQALNQIFANLAIQPRPRDHGRHRHGDPDMEEDDEYNETRQDAVSDEDSIIEDTQIDRVTEVTDLLTPEPEKVKKGKEKLKAVRVLVKQQPTLEAPPRFLLGKRTYSRKRRAGASRHGHSSRQSTSSHDVFKSLARGQDNVAGSLTPFSSGSIQSHETHPHQGDKSVSEDSIWAIENVLDNRERERTRTPMDVDSMSLKSVEHQGSSREPSLSEEDEDDDTLIGFRQRHGKRRIVLSSDSESDSTPDVFEIPLDNSSSHHQVTHTYKKRARRPRSTPKPATSRPASSDIFAFPDVPPAPSPAHNTVSLESAPRRIDKPATAPAPRRPVARRRIQPEDTLHDFIENDIDQYIKTKKQRRKPKRSADDRILPRERLRGVLPFSYLKVREHIEPARNRRARVQRHTSPRVSESHRQEEQSENEQDNQDEEDEEEQEQEKVLGRQPSIKRFFASMQPLPSKRLPPSPETESADIPLPIEIYPDQCEIIPKTRMTPDDYYSQTLVSHLTALLRQLPADRDTFPFNKMTHQIFDRTVSLDLPDEQRDRVFRNLFYQAFSFLADPWDRIDDQETTAERDMWERNIELRTHQCTTFYNFVSSFLTYWLPYVSEQQQQLTMVDFLNQQITGLCRRVHMLANMDHFMTRPHQDPRMPVDQKWMMVLSLYLYTLDWSVRLEPYGRAGPSYPLLVENSAKRLLWLLFWIGPDVVEAEPQPGEDAQHVANVGAVVLEAWVYLLNLYDPELNKKDQTSSCRDSEFLWNKMTDFLQYQANEEGFSEQEKNERMWHWIDFLEIPRQLAKNYQNQ